MPQSELEEYILNSRLAGVEDSIARETLVTTGWPEAQIDQAFSNVGPPGDKKSSAPVRPRRKLLHILAGVVLLVASLFFAGMVLVTAGPVLLLALFSFGGSTGIGLQVGLPPMLRWLSAIFIASMLFINGISLLKTRQGARFRFPLWQRILWPILILVPIAASIALQREPKIASISDPTSGSSAAVKTVSKIYPVWYSSLDTEGKDALVNAYKALHLRYENPVPTTPEEYFQYSRCANYILSTVIERTNEEGLQEIQAKGPLGQAEFDVHYQFGKSIEREIGAREYLRYDSVLGGGVYDGTEGDPSKAACADLNVSDKYKQ